MEGLIRDLFYRGGANLMFELREFEYLRLPIVPGWVVPQTVSFRAV
jgi:hypothetical protein